MPKGHGVRHLVAGKNGFYYAANELMSTVSVLKFDAEAKTLTCLSSYSCGVSMEGNTAAAIRISKDGGHLFISQRGADTVSVFSISEDGRRLSLLHNIPCGGRDPRDMILTPDERFLLCANQSSEDLIRSMRSAVAEQARNMSKVLKEYDEMKRKYLALKEQVDIPAVETLTPEEFAEYVGE